jgi:DNA-binding IscR family transcriptional regulator
MSTRLDVQQALACLKALDEHPETPLDAQEITQRKGIPYDTVREIIQRLHAAGIVECHEDGRVQLEKPTEELTSLEILEALWAPPAAPSFRMLIAQRDGQRVGLTLQAVLVLRTVEASRPQQGSLN